VLFDEVEQSVLQPLPPSRCKFATWKPARVNIDYHLEFETRLYSVPHRLVREGLEVRATATVLKILHRGRSRRRRVFMARSSLTRTPVYSSVLINTRSPGLRVFPTVSW
jgi:Mu transposase-like protein